MNYMQNHPEARQWLTPDHQAVLAIIARWADEAADTEAAAPKAGAQEGAPA